MIVSLERVNFNTEGRVILKKSLGAKVMLSPLPVLVIGTYNADMKPNAMTAAFGSIVSAAPPTLGVSIRKATLTYENIMRSREFTISIPSETYVKEIDYLGIVSGRNHAKFLETGLTAIKGTYVDAPYVEEFPVNLECKLITINELGLHTQFIGEIVDAKISAEMLNEKGTLDTKKMKPISFLGNENSYYGLGNNLGGAFSLGKEIEITKKQ
jgi:flavin reductase (DIM6/NTAB) family NADH-FMN oxidoreductase RutF